MLSPVGFSILICFVLGTAMIVAMTLIVGRTSSTGASIAEVLYKAEHPGKTR